MLKSPRINQTQHIALLQELITQIRMRIGEYVQELQRIAQLLRVQCLQVLQVHTPDQQANSLLGHLRQLNAEHIDQNSVQYQQPLSMYQQLRLQLKHDHRYTDAVCKLQRLDEIRTSVAKIQKLAADCIPTVTAIKKRRLD